MIDTAKKLNASIKETAEAKEYYRLKEELLKDDYINKLLENIKQTQKDLRKYLDNNEIEKYKIEKAKLEIYKNEFNNYPLVNNYVESKKTLYNLLEQIISIIGE